jgi:hypothetical protein
MMPLAARRSREEAGRVSFIQRAREVAESAATKAQEAAASATRTAQDPATTERINKSLSSAGQASREAAGFARKSVTTVIERIDPGTLAELIVKATALQEMTNKALRAKGSPYRISELSIAATIPPGVTFAIGRIDDEPEELSDVVLSSAALLEADPEAGDLVISLDGTTVDGDALEASEGGVAAGEAAGETPGEAPPNATASA